MAHLQVGLAVVAKNEGELVSEWLAYHAALGVQKLVVYDNNSTDDTRSRVLAASREIDAIYVPWVSEHKNFQSDVYNAAARRFGPGLDWIGFLDADEFLSVGEGMDLESVLSSPKLSDAPGLAINWLVYGSNGYAERPHGLVTENFTRRSKEWFGPNQHVKCLVRPSYYLRSENCHAPTLKSGTYHHSDGLPVDWMHYGVTQEVRETTTISVNHYFVRSRACWQKKMERGYRSGFTRPDSDFYDYDRNDVEDVRAAKVGAIARDRFGFLQQAFGVKPSRRPKGRSALRMALKV